MYILFCLTRPSIAKMEATTFVKSLLSPFAGPFVFISSYLPLRVRYFIFIFRHFERSVLIFVKNSSTSSSPSSSLSSSSLSSSSLSSLSDILSKLPSFFSSDGDENIPFILSSNGTSAFFSSVPELAAAATASGSGSGSGSASASGAFSAVLTGASSPFNKFAKKPGFSSSLTDLVLSSSSFEPNNPLNNPPLSFSFSAPTLLPSAD